MKTIRITRAAEDALADILDFSITQWGLSRATAYKDRLVARLHSLARGDLPYARPCGQLLPGRRDVDGLCYFREGSHVLILRETADMLLVIDVIHQSRDLERLIAQFAGSSEPNRG